MNFVRRVHEAVFVSVYGIHSAGQSCRRQKLDIASSFINAEEIQACVTILTRQTVVQAGAFCICGMNCGNCLSCSALVERQCITQILSSNGISTTCWRHHDGRIIFANNMQIQSLVDRVSKAITRSETETRINQNIFA